MLKMAFLTPSRSERCGIWTYTNYMHQAMQPLLKDEGIEIKLFMNFDEFKATKYKYDLVHIQDEYGIVPNEMLSHFNDKKIPYVITMHTIWDRQKMHHDLLEDRSCKLIILHSEDQLRILSITNPMIASKVKIIPHGSFPSEVDDYKPRKDKVVFGAFGFSGFPKRFIETLISLKNTDLDFSYNVLSSYQDSNNDSILYSQKLTDIALQERRDAESEGRETKFKLDNRFLDEEVIIKKLKTCDILLSSVAQIIAPSVSGSSRFLMRAARPVIVTDIYHYSDVPDDTFIKIHPTMPPKQFEWAVKKIMKDYNGYINRIKKYTKKTSWKVTADKHFKLYKKIYETTINS